MRRETQRFLAAVADAIDAVDGSARGRGGGVHRRGHVRQGTSDAAPRRTARAGPDRRLRRTADDGIGVHRQLHSRRRRPAHRRSRCVGWPTCSPGCSSPTSRCRPADPELRRRRRTAAVRARGADADGGAGSSKAELRLVACGSGRCWSRRSSIEVAATLSLRASQDHSAWLVVVVAGYVGSFILLTMVLRTGMPVGVAYGIWGALRHGGDGGAGRGDLRRPVHLADRGGHRADHRGCSACRVRIAARPAADRAVMWLALAGAIVIEVVATLALRASDGFRKKAWIVPVIARLSRVVLSAVADAVAGHAGWHRLWRVDGMRRRAGRGHREIPVRRTADLVDGLGIALIVAGVLTIEMAGAAH